MIFRSIRARLTASFTLYIAVLTVAAVTGLIWYSQRVTEHNANSLLISTAKRIVMETSDPREHDAPLALIEEERENLRGSGLVISVLSGSGRVIEKSQKDAPESLNTNRNYWRVYKTKLKSGDTIIVGIPWVKIRAELRSHEQMLAWLGTFVVMIASVGAWVLVGRTLTPISSLARQAKASSADDLAINLELPSQDYEMVELVDTLNDLLRRITETTAAKGRFYSAASHELRTPLQALSGHLELALSRDRTKDEYKAATEEAYVQTRRLISLVRALLFLYQLDSSTKLPIKEPVDLVDIYRRSLSHFQPNIEERGLQVSIKMPAEVEVLVPPDHIDMLVRNLIENATKYASANGQISLAIEADTRSIRLEVANDCVTPPNWNPEDLFEPFARVDSSRNSKTGGTGLGLAICKSIADVNGWGFWMEAREQSARAVVTIPKVLLKLE